MTMISKMKKIAGLTLIFAGIIFFGLHTHASALTKNIASLTPPEFQALGQLKAIHAQYIQDGNTAAALSVQSQINSLEAKSLTTPEQDEDARINQEADKIFGPDIGGGATPVSVTPAGQPQGSYQMVVKLPGIETQTAEGGPAQFINNFYKFSLLIAGLLSIGLLTYHSLRYTLSTGNTSITSDAIDGMKQAIFGLGLLMSSYLLLYTINPDLVNLKNPGEGIGVVEDNRIEDNRPESLTSAEKFALSQIHDNNGNFDPALGAKTADYFFARDIGNEELLALEMIRDKLTGYSDEQSKLTRDNITLLLSNSTQFKTNLSRSFELYKKLENNAYLSPFEKHELYNLKRYLGDSEKVTRVATTIPGINDNKKILSDYKNYVGKLDLSGKYDSTATTNRASGAIYEMMNSRIPLTNEMYDYLGEIRTYLNSKNGNEKIIRELDLFIQERPKDH